MTQAGWAWSAREAKVGVLAVIVAAAAAFAVGAVCYMALARPWIADSGVPVDAQGHPTGRGPAITYGGAFLCILLVAGMMRHVLATAGITTAGAGAVAGLGVGLFLIAPWIALNVLFAMRPLRLAAIDGGYAVAGCAVMGAVLGLMP
jgi:hypothetical protein